MRRYDLTNQRFGRLTVIERADDYVYPSGKHRSQWKCRCDCGKIIIAEHSNLTCGNTKSCGCLNDELRRERSTIHGCRHTRLYGVWTNMKDRCYNENSDSYKDYGLKGITICDEWKNSFEAFKDWSFANGYNENADKYECTIDRIDVSKGYYPDNCRWVNAKVQANNRANTLRYEFNGEEHTLSEWSDILGVKYHTLFARINILNWPIEKALSIA